MAGTGITPSDPDQPRQCLRIAVAADAHPATATEMQTSAACGAGASLIRGYSEKVEARLGEFQSGDEILNEIERIKDELRPIVNDISDAKAGRIRIVWPRHDLGMEPKMNSEKYWWVRGKIDHRKMGLNVTDHTPSFNLHAFYENPDYVEKLKSWGIDYEWTNGKEEYRPHFPFVTSGVLCCSAGLFNSLPLAAEQTVSFRVSIDGEEYVVFRPALVVENLDMSRSTYRTLSLGSLTDFSEVVLATQPEENMKMFALKHKAQRLFLIIVCDEFHQFYNDRGLTGLTFKEAWPCDTTT
ncbi:hypothetical protein [Halodurantibacterium flavum]|uniref:Uncharacterized protein n=1 Tax=Halodurantibacterium flavum TaxID=1382802 RepID=A0ABW4RZ43_9RHOB